MSILSENRVQYENALMALFEDFETIFGELGAGGGTILPTRLGAINYVKAKLNELIPEGEGIIFKLSDAPNISNPLDLLINAHLDECTKDVILSAPISTLFPTSLSTTAGTALTDNKTGYIPLPANFLRFISLKMADWKRSVSTLITPENPIYRKQSLPRLRGNTISPVAVLVWRKGSPNTRAIEYYSVKSSHSIDQLLYVPETKTEDFVTANPHLLDSLAWMCAGKIMQITGMLNEAKLASERVVQSYTNL